MKTIVPDVGWPESWVCSYTYDQLEIYGATHNRGYRYAYQNRHCYTLKLIQKAVPVGAKILDVAAAQGNFSLALAALGYEVTWNDLRSELADYVKLKWDYGDIHYQPGNVFELDLAATFDLVLIAEVIEHTAHPDQFLQKITGLVKPGGYVVMSTPNGEYFRNSLPKFSECPDPSQFESIQFQPNSDGHIFLLHLDEVQSLSNRAGLNMIDIVLFSNFVTSGHVKFHHLLKLLPYPWVQVGERLSQRLPRSIQRKINTGMAVLFQKRANSTPSPKGTNH